MLAQSLLVLASAALSYASPVTCRAPMPDPVLPTTGGGKSPTTLTLTHHSLTPAITSN